jgi:hypothetical protein
MRVHDISCPKCGAGLKSKAGIPVGRTVPCPKCKSKFRVEPPDDPNVIDVEDVEELEVDEPAPKKKAPRPAPVSTRKPARRRDDDEDDEDEEDEPAARKKGPPAKVGKRRDDDEDDEEDERPRKKKRWYEEEEEESVFLRLKQNIWVRIVTLAVLLGILAVVAYVYYDMKIKPRNEENQQNKPAKDGDVRLDRPGRLGYA